MTLVGSQRLAVELETLSEKRGYLRRMLWMHFWHLVTCGFCIAIATIVMATGLEHAREDNGHKFLAAAVPAAFALFFWHCAANTQANMLDRWCAFRKPLPAIDGTELVLTRKRAGRWLATIFLIGWLALWSLYLIVLWPKPVVTAVVGIVFMYPAVSSLIAMWRPRANLWEPLILDRHGFEDRSSDAGRIAWSDVPEIAWENGGIQVHLTKPSLSARNAGSISKINGWLNKLPRSGSRSDANKLKVHGHGLDSHRTFRLLRAYWRYASETPTTQPAR